MVTVQYIEHIFLLWAYIYIDCFYWILHMNFFIYSPLDQFEIRNLFSIDTFLLGNLNLSITNIGLYMTMAAFIVFALNILATNSTRIAANKWSLSLESIYATIHGIVINQINNKDGQIYFPFMYVLFTYILINNLIGMVPYSFASTSHFILTFSLSFTVVLGTTILGFKDHKLKFFSFFVPAGCPLGLLPLLVLIEFISYLARNVSLGLRLAANILAGHMLLNILSGFTYNIMNSGFIFFILALLPLAFIVAFSGLELGIAFIQSQVFVVLSCSYIKDALDLH
jgi:F-type H+-transporting ATPase subunit a